MARPVRVVSGWTPGGGGRLRELITLPPWLILLGRTGLWFVRHYIITAHLALWWCLVTWAGVAGGTIWFLLITGVTVAGYVGLSGRRAGVPLGPTLTALSRRWVLRRRWPTCASGAKLTAGSGDGARIAPVKKYVPTSTGGLRLTVDVGAVAKTVDDLRTNVGAIASVVHAQRATVRAGADMGLATVELSWSDPLIREVRLSDLPPPTSSRLTFGLTADDLPVSIALDSATLITGVTRSGKSGVIWALLAMVRVLYKPDEVRLWVIDPKGGMELRALRPHAYRYAKEISEIVAVLREAATEMKERQDELGDEGLRKFTASSRTPWNIIIVDEFLAITMFMPQREKDAAERALGLMVTQGAAAGFTPWFATQGAQMEALGRIRTFIPQRICLKVDSPESAEAALGGTGTRYEAPAHKISIRTPGIGYLAHEGQEGFVRFRSAWVTDPETREVAAGRVPPLLRQAQERITTLNERTTYVYKLYDDMNRPLRYGIAQDVEERLKAYENLDWWERVRYREIETYPNRKMALAVEAAAIDQDRPEFNDQHNPDFRLRVRRMVKRERSNTAA